VFNRFKPMQIQTSDPEVKINLRCGGSGAPLLLLHGNPLSHMSWHRYADRLTEEFTVVAADLRGYGDSSKPRGKEDHSNYSFRRMAQDQVDIMQHLGFEKFFVAGHDRGARTAHRMALDHREKVLRLAVMDILPSHHVWTHVNKDWAINSYHWQFMAQPYDFPERLLKGNEEYYIRRKLMKQGLGKGGFSEEEILEYIRCCTPENIHGVCEDYRACATIDFEMDTADYSAGRKVDCPTLVLWGERSHTNKHFTPRDAWPQYASNIVRFACLPCGHYPSEQAPEETYAELRGFFSS